MKSTILVPPAAVRAPARRSVAGRRCGGSPPELPGPAGRSALSSITSSCEQDADALAVTLAAAVKKFADLLPPE
ncbi:hypothetical protein ACKXF4_08470 [Faecalibacterium prausnitzii]|uniref:hypothetical protein n=1 Tax=Faecalibacterium prausnitzii TaxID=853 RepID=UPI003AB099DD